MLLLLLKWPLKWLLRLRLRLLLKWPLLFKSPLSAPWRRYPEREKVRRLFECSAAERV